MLANPYPCNLASAIVSDFVVAKVQLPQLVIVPLPQGVGQSHCACMHTVLAPSCTQGSLSSQACQSMLLLRPVCWMLGRGLTGWLAMSQAGDLHPEAEPRQMHRCTSCQVHASQMASLINQTAC